MLTDGRKNLEAIDLHKQLTDEVTAHQRWSLSLKGNGGYFGNTPLAILTEDMIGDTTIHEFWSSYKCKLDQNLLHMAVIINSYSYNETIAYLRYVCKAKTI